MLEIGDTVKCIKEDVDLTINNEYKVTKASYTYAGGSCIHVNNGNNSPYYEDYFVLVFNNNELQYEIC